MKERSIMDALYYQLNDILHSETWIEWSQISVNTILIYWETYNLQTLHQ